LHDELKEYLKHLKDLRAEVKALEAEGRERVSRKAILNRTEELASQWFSELLPKLLSDYSSPAELIDGYSSDFSQLLKLSAPNNLAKSYIGPLNSVIRHFRDDFILPLQREPRLRVSASALTQLLANLPDDQESEYLQEAIECARAGHFRAAVVLGWCATIDRIHRKIAALGFTSFNVTSSKMATQNKGKYKRFNQAQTVQSLGDLREVFDTIVLRIIEGMGLIDPNQHTRLRSCFDMRCQCAHPGEAPITEYNLMSFLSDIEQIVLRNDDFQI
jgi:hypothetical protein